MLRTFLRRAPQTGHLMRDRISSVSRHRISRSTRPDSIARCRSRGSPTRYFSSPFRSFSTSCFSLRWLSTIGRVLRTRTRESRIRSSLGIRYDGIVCRNPRGLTKVSEGEASRRRHRLHLADDSPGDGNEHRSSVDFLVEIQVERLHDQTKSFVRTRWGMTEDAIDAQDSVELDATLGDSVDVDETEAALERVAANHGCPIRLEEDQRRRSERPRGKHVTVRVLVDERTRAARSLRHGFHVAAGLNCQRVSVIRHGNRWTFVRKGFADRTASTDPKPHRWSLRTPKGGRDFGSGEGRAGGNWARRKIAVGVVTHRKPSRAISTSRIPDGAVKRIVSLTTVLPSAEHANSPSRASLYAPNIR